MPRVFPSFFLRLLAGGCLAASASISIAAEWAVDADHVSVYFAGSHFDISYVHGRFAKITATVHFDPDAKTGQAVVTIDADSIDTGNRTLDGILRSPQFLDSAANPEIRYLSSQFVFDGDRLVRCRRHIVAARRAASAAPRRRAFHVQRRCGRHRPAASLRRRLSRCREALRVRHDAVSPRRRRRNQARYRHRGHAALTLAPGTVAYAEASQRSIGFIRFRLACT